ncbi:capsule biosynthesis protein [Roseobacter ponti]|uniref:Capsule biosynthesis protein n=1 Tax=Roseobacter ponti TaxID=1891787 RepID=A0A858SUP5_9RHOB|nr:capsule biosynthesis protein [Roseobacter ponti]QJF52405.1 capsule biosynthesis protein [Roseobacter ponti]
MTTKPTARKYRIRRTGPEPGTRPAASAEQQPAATPQQPAPDAGPAAAAQPGRELPGRQVASAKSSPERPPEANSNAQAQAGVPPKARAQQAAAKPSGSPETVALQLDAIRREGLTGRQLRMARRIAHKHELAPTSDFDAVRLLRARGIDPFQRANMLELVVPGGEAAAKQATGTGQEPTGRIQLPQTVPGPSETLPSTNVSPAEQRNRQISEIQADISRRRRRKMVMLVSRLAAFVMLPTLIAGIYFFFVATPMYATKSEFLILQADAQAGGAAAGLLSGTQFATSQDSIAVQSYLQSKDAMLRLDRDIGFKSHFTQPWIDPIQRMSEDPTNEDAYRAYQKRVKVGYDPTEGVLRMEVVAADPEISARYSQALIDYAEERVNSLSQQKRGDQMAEAEKSFRQAEEERRAAQEALVNLQLQGATLDPEAVIASLRQQITQVEMQVLEKELQLAALLDNSRPNQSRVDGARGDIRRLNEQLAELNARMTDASQGENSLAQLSVRSQMAQADLATRDMLLQSALQQMEQTRLEANRQVRYLTTSVRPVAPQEASYPRSFENTILAFLIFAGVYLMVSLTASILREQVTS